MVDKSFDVQDMHLLAEREILTALKAGGLLRGDVQEMLDFRIGALVMPHGTSSPSVSLFFFLSLMIETTHSLFEDVHSLYQHSAESIATQSSCLLQEPCKHNQE